MREALVGLEVLRAAPSQAVERSPAVAVMLSDRRKMSVRCGRRMRCAHPPFTRTQ